MCFWTEQGCIPFAFNSLYKRRRVFSSEKWYNLALIYEIGFLFYPSQYISMSKKRSKRSLSCAKGLNFLLSIIVSGTFYKIWFRQSNVLQGLWGGMKMQPQNDCSIIYHLKADADAVLY